MAYIGSTPTSQNFISGTDYFNGTGSQTAFTLTRPVNSVNDVEVVVNNVIQQPNSYTVSGTTLTLSAAPSSGTSNVYVRYLATNQQSFTVGNNTVGYNQLTSDMQSKFAMKNRIINGAMVIDQRNAGASVALTNGYCLDRFVCNSSQTNKFTTQQNAGSVTPPPGFTNYLGVTSSSSYSVISSDSMWIGQRIEGYNVADLNWGTANASSVTFSFWVRSSLTGTFGGSVFNGAANRFYVYSYVINSANTWEQKSITIPGDTTGTWLKDNGIGLAVLWSVGTGSTYLGAAGSWGSTVYTGVIGQQNVVGTNGATFYITGVQLEVGTSATGFEYRQYQQELALCQRYYEYGLTFSGPAPAGLNPFISQTFIVTKRATPSISVTANTSITGGSAGTTYYSGTGQPYMPDTIKFVLTNPTAGNSIGATWTASAEL